MRAQRFALLLVAILVLHGGAPDGVAGPTRFADAQSRRHDARDRTMDVRHTVLRVSFDWERRSVEGFVSLTLRPITPAARSVELDAAELRIRRVTLEGAREIPFRHDGEKLRIDLPQALPASGDPVVTIEYDGTPRKGLHFVGPDEGYPGKPRQIWSQGEAEDNRYWFPTYDYPNDKATSEVFVTVRAGETAISNGYLVGISEEPARGRRTFHWKMDQPHSSYLTSVVVGEFEQHDDAFGDTPVQYFVPKGTGREMTMRSFGLTPDMMRFYSDSIGVRYPYAKYAQTCVHDFIFGGMENITATTQTVATLHGPEAEPERSSQGLVAHELAHQWWGNLLTCRDWAHIWLNEGFATYFEALYREHRDGLDEFRYDLLKDARAYLEEDSKEYRRAIVTNVYSDPMDLFDSHTYPKGAWCLHMIRGILGDELFWRSIRRYAETNAWKNVVTDDLRRAIEEATGRNLDWFFDQWLLRGGHPEFRVETDFDPDTSLLHVSVTQTQAVDDLTPIFRMPVDVEVRTSAGARTWRVEISKASHEFVLPVAEPPLLVRFDPHHWILKTLDQPRTLAELQFAALHDDHVAGRALVAEELGRRTGDPAAARILEMMATADAFWGIRAEAAEALGRVGGTAAWAALRVCLADRDSRVRSKAAAALGGARGDAESIVALRERFESDSSPFVRAEALRALARVQAPDAAELARKALGADSPQEILRARALDALADLEHPEATSIAIEWTRYGKPTDARIAAAAVLARIGEGSRAARERLVEMLEDRNFAARRAALAALRDLGDPTTAGALEARAKVDADGRLRKAARAAAQSVRSQKESTSRLSALRGDLDRLQSDYARVLERLEAIERKNP
jgi:aminopeptidase N